MALGKGRGKVAYADIKKDDSMAGPRNNGSFTPSTTEQAMDEYLRNINMYRKPVAKDGSCLFRVVAEQVFFTQFLHKKVRTDCISYMNVHRKIFESFIEGSFEHHLFNLRNLKEWGGHSEISALSLLYKYDFIVYQIANPTPQDVTKNGFDKKIHLCYLNNNHYDCVYPISFKSSAAIAQSIVYEILLGNVFAEVDKREMEADCTDISEAEESQDPSAWTEVKTKQNKGKMVDGKQSDNPWENLISVIPESNKNPRVMRSLTASLDPSVYRNIELDVWENTRSEQQKFDQVVAAAHQFKPGDVCIATIRESKDHSKQVIVRVQKVGEKCIVVPEDKDVQYYVHLDDLQPMVNGEHDYRSLPGYYNKYENEQEFQSQKRRKYRKGREEERKVNEFQNNQQNRSRGSAPVEKDTNRGGGRKNNQRKEKSVSPTKNQQRENTVPKKTEKTENELAPVVNGSATTEESVTKVAKPAETAAAFWGRMRSNPAQEQPPNDATTPTTKTTDELIKKNNLTPTNANSDKLESSEPTDRAPEPIQIVKNKKKTNTAPIADASKQDTAQIDIRNNQKSPETTTANSQPVSSPPKDIKKLSLTSQASAKVKKVRENILMSSAKIESGSITSPSKSELKTSPVKEEVPKKVTEEDSIGVTMAKEIKQEAPSPIIQKRDETNLEKPPTQSPPTIHKHTDSTSGCFETKVEQLDLNKNTQPNIIVNPESQRSSVEMSENRPTRPPKLGKVKKKVSFGSTTEIIETIHNIPSLIPQPDEIQQMSPQQAPIPPQKQTPVIPSGGGAGGERGKIHIPRDHIEKHMNYQHQQQQQSHNQINMELHHPTQQNYQPITTGINQQQQHMTPESLQQQYIRILQSQQQSPFVSHNTASNNIQTFYHPAATQANFYPVIYRQGNNVDMRTTHLQLSQDPEAKDLPEDPQVVQYFYNLGVQYCMMMGPQNFHQQVNQAGILPLPVANTPMQQVPVHQLVLNNSSENSRNTTNELYVANSPQQQTETSLMDMQQHHPVAPPSQAQQIVTPASLQTRLQHHQQPQQAATNLATGFQHQHQPRHPRPNLSDYETPPRHRRGLISPHSGALSQHNVGLINSNLHHRSNNQRHISQRHNFNGGRGIIGQGPKPMRIDHIRPSNNF